MRFVKKKTHQYLCIQMTCVRMHFPNLKFARILVRKINACIHDHAHELCQRKNSCIDGVDDVDTLHVELANIK